MKYLTSNKNESLDFKIKINWENETTLNLFIPNEFSTYIDDLMELYFIFKCYLTDLNSKIKNIYILESNQKVHFLIKRKWNPDYELFIILDRPVESTFEIFKKSFDSAYYNTRNIGTSSEEFLMKNSEPIGIEIKFSTKIISCWPQKNKYKELTLTEFAQFNE